MGWTTGIELVTMTASVGYSPCKLWLLVFGNLH